MTSYPRTWTLYRPIEDISISEISEISFPHETFTDIVRLPDNQKFYVTEKCGSLVRGGLYKPNQIYTVTPQKKYYMKNNDKYLTIEITNAKKYIPIMLAEETTTVFAMFYNQPHADWVTLFDVYKLRALL